MQCNVCMYDAFDIVSETRYPISRNVLIGVLGSNFGLYQDRAPELFNRARAKLLLDARRGVP